MSWHPQYRSSKFRHVFGKAASKENCYDSVPITRSVHDNHFCAVNPHFIAVVTECAGGGAFLVIPLHQTGKLDPHYPKVCGHRGNVLDIKWNPFNDFQIASCSEDATIKIWDIPKQLLTRNLTTYSKELVGHARRVGLVEWHPTAANILFSAGYDYKVMIWNLDTKESVIMSPVKTIACHQDVILSMSFNTNGSLLATTCKDRKIRVLDPRLGTVLQEASYKEHRANKVLFLGSMKKLLSTGTSRWNNRQMVLWNQPHLSGVMPKRGLDVSSCEIFRFYKLITTKSLIEPVSMIVPRRSESYQEDIYPPTAGAQPSLSAQEWLSGMNKDPVLMSLRPGSQLLSPQPLPPERPLSTSGASASSPPLGPTAKLAVDVGRKSCSLPEGKVTSWTTEHQLEEKKSWLTNGFDVFECPPPKTENELLQMFYRQQEEIRRLRELVTQREVQAKQLELEIKNLQMSLGQY
ncbi:PREDICTED: coronin-2A [Dipodomys ordii]|uniref:Coronin n=1 Tax=Dipodomys ordii TaxID=10020 RepID=A0A1S3FRP1_DIPOR|nr:PREDICTED: coronin-2A [Dipodomys ordii]